MRFIFFVFILTLISACTEYKQPEFESANLATIQGSFQRNGMLTFRSAEIVEIDGKSTGLNLSQEASFKIASGHRTIKIHAAYLEGSPSQQEAFPVLEFIAIPGESYTAYTNHKNDIIDVAIKDSKSNVIVSKVIKSSTQEPIPVTIFK